jgi:hypothetical protein
VTIRSFLVIAFFAAAVLSKQALAEQPAPETKSGAISRPSEPNGGPPQPQSKPASKGREEQEKAPEIDYSPESAHEGAHDLFQVIKSASEKKPQDKK